MNVNKQCCDCDDAIESPLSQSSVPHLPPVWIESDTKVIISTSSPSCDSL